MTPAKLRALRLILATGGVEIDQIHGGRQDGSVIHPLTALGLIKARLARWEVCPVRETPRPSRRCHAQLRRWGLRQKRGTILTLHATAAGCVEVMKAQGVAASLDLT